MKKLFITAIALGFVVTTTNATTLETLESPMLGAAISKGKVNAFCISIVKGDIETVKKLIDLGTDVNEKSNGMAPLHYAAKYNKVEIVKLLVENGAKMNARCDKGFTVKKYAEISNAKETVALLAQLKQEAKEKRRA